jgi:hypothetical protein
MNQKLVKKSLLVASIAAFVAFEAATAPDLCAAGPPQSFSEDILPLLKWRCSGCHEAKGEGLEKSGLDLSTYEGVMKGTKFGRMVIPGDAASSNLMMLIDWRVSPQIRMPHNKKQLSKCDRDAIRAWINEGAKNN